MYLDESILQSRTTISLVDFIKKLYKHVTPQDLIMAEGLKKDYDEIIRQTNKAVKKRSY
jgi:GTP-dependent phosphoenolpyruvate carboxykinase|tara:strand:+ start:123 stop:299 length:177 start_codon:yes stop_codon:yes gene_type:complete